MRSLICSFCLSIVIAPVVARTESERPVLGENPSFIVDDMGWQDTLEPFWTKQTPF